MIFQRISYFSSLLDAKIAIETAKEAIDTSNDALNVLNTVLNQIASWKSFKEVTEKLKEIPIGSSAEGGRLVGNIITHLMPIIDVYNFATGEINKWFNLSEPLLTSYISLFNDGNETEQMQQKTCLVDVLQDLKQHLENIQKQLDISVEHFKAISEHSTSLGVQFSDDFNENGEYFHRQLATMIKGSHDAKGCQWNCFGSSTNDDKLFRELKEKLNSILQFCENLNVQADQAIIDAEHVKLELEDKIQVISEQERRVNETKTYAVVGNIAELRNSAIESANNLIVNCNAYLKNHSV